MREKKKPNIPLQQSRLAGLNHNSKTVHHQQSPTPETRKQVGLETFGFKFQGARAKKSPPPTLLAPSASPMADEACNSEPIKKKRKKRHLAVDDEVAETQFAQPEPYSDSEHEENLSVVAAPLTPVSAPPRSPIKQALAPMGPPPTTPRRRRPAEIPSSHSPPVTPFTPYTSQTNHSKSPPMSPSLSRKKAQASTKNEWERKTIWSSQWWENEDTQSTAPGGLFLYDDEEVEDESLPENSPVKRALFKREVSGSAPGLKWGTRAANEAGKDGEDRQSSCEEEPSLPDEHQESQVSMGYVDFSDFTQPGGVVNKVRSPSPEEAPWKSNQEDQLNSEHNNEHVPEQDDNPPSSPPAFRNITPHAETTPIETQYPGVDASYGWWDIDPLPEEKEKGGQERKVETDKSSDDGEMATMSQLLPETLMETFPMPPPITQFSGGIPNWNYSDI